MRAHTVESCRPFVLILNPRVNAPIGCTSLHAWGIPAYLRNASMPNFDCLRRQSSHKWLNFSFHAVWSPGLQRSISCFYCSLWPANRRYYSSTRVMFVLPAKRRLVGRCRAPAIRKKYTDNLAVPPPMPPVSHATAIRFPHHCLNSSKSMQTDARVTVADMQPPTGILATSDVVLFSPSGRWRHIGGTPFGRDPRFRGRRALRLFADERSLRRAEPVMHPHQRALDGAPQPGTTETSIGR